MVHAKRAASGGWVSWVLAACLGAFGGFIVSAIALGRDVFDYQGVRRLHLQHKRADLPRFAEFIDPPADTLVLLTRLAFGAIAGGLFHSEIVAAIGVGATAPALLSQFANFPNSRSSRSRDSPDSGANAEGDTVEAASSAELASHGSEIGENFANELEDQKPKYQPKHSKPGPVPQPRAGSDATDRGGVSD